MATISKQLRLHSNVELGLVDGQLPCGHTSLYLLFDSISQCQLSAYKVTESAIIAEEYILVGDYLKIKDDSFIFQTSVEITEDLKKILFSDNETNNQE